MEPQQPQEERWCRECDESRTTQPASDRLCDICGTVLTQRQQGGGQSAASTTGQTQQLRDMPRFSGPGGPGGEAARQWTRAGATVDERRRRLSLLMLQAVGRDRDGEEEDEEGATMDEQMASWTGMLAGVDLGALRAAFEGGPGGGDGAPKGLTEEEIAALPRSTLQKTSTLLLACTLTVVDGDGDEEGPALEMAAIPGDFSPVPSEGEAVELVAGEPVTADAAAAAEGFANAEVLKGKVVVVRRGKQRFGRMVLMARAAGARGVVVVNSVPLWPYLMKDTVGEVKSAGEGTEEGTEGWFIAMVPQKEGEALLARLQEGVVCGGRMAVTRVEKECVICVETFGEGEEVVRLPACGHGFHAACVQKWLGMARTCPYCRAGVKVRV